MRIESNCQTGEIKYFDDADNEIDAPQLIPEPEVVAEESTSEPVPADEPEVE